MPGLLHFPPNDRADGSRQRTTPCAESHSFRLRELTLFWTRGKVIRSEELVVVLKESRADFQNWPWYEETNPFLGDRQRECIPPSLRG
jgi:hypothetical protein